MPPQFYYKANEVVGVARNLLVRFRGVTLEFFDSSSKPIIY
ncbi:hypothetical protein THICB2_340009 [Thiomonas sp. CB2]|nr:hypothetical protein THICB2_340009 [Thiomonas sp. CB2]